jgi:hypothetical protein
MAVRVKHPPEPVDLAGDTTFYFVTDGIENALERAIQAAADVDVLGTNPSAASAPNSWQPTLPCTYGWPKELAS